MSTSPVSSSSTGTNIDVASIVSQLMTVEQRPLTQLASKQAGIQSKISAYGSVQGALSGFQTAMAGLTNVSSLQALTATSSNTATLTASAAKSAAPGTYSINVTALAQAQQLAALGQVSQTAAISNGVATTVTFDFGTTSGASFTSNGNGTKSITIDATNNSLQGIRDAINAANIGVTASIVNDGTASPYRLTLSSSSPGANNSMKITTTGGDGTINTLLGYDPAGVKNLTQTAAAQNAAFTINGVAVSKSSNSVVDAIPGVTLNLQQASSTTLSIARDTSAIPTAVNNFVAAYNTLHTAITSVTAYDAANKQGAILQGDFAVNAVARQVRAILNTPVNSGGTLTSLADIGVTFQKDGSLAVNTTKLNTAITNNYSSIAGLFGTVGSASDSLVSYSSATSATQAGSYAVNVTQLATQGTSVGNVNLNLAGPTTIAAGTTLNVGLDGNAVSVALAAGTYTATQLAAMIQSAINGTPTFANAGSSVAIGIDAVTGFMTATSQRYGSASNVSLGVGTGTNPSVFMGTASATPGLNVAGTIGGQAATGSGQTLTSSSGGATGLAIQINGGALGARGTVSYTQGYAYLLNQYAIQQSTSTGLMKTATDGMNKSIADIQKQQDALKVRLAAIQANYTAQFTALDKMLSSMNSTQQYLTQQLANLPKAN